MPEVSVLMTVYNGMPFLKAAVDSILRQSLEEFQFVIVNDGSTDGTSDFLASIDDKRVQIVTQENGGTAAAANAGLARVVTPFVARMDADDIAVPDRLARQLEFLKSNPHVGLVGAQIVPLGEHGEGRSLDLPMGHDRIFSALMQKKHGLAHNVIMMRTATLKSIGGYWKHRLLDDWDMMIRMGEVAKLENMSDVLLKYRIHSGSINGTSQMRIHLHYGYAIKLAELRQSGQSEISFSEYEKLLQMRPWYVRAIEKIHVHSISQYRIALTEIHGKQKIRGYSRIVWAAFCSPRRTVNRVGRIARRLSGRNESQLSG